MRVADYIWRSLADRGVDHVFLVTGGGAMHLNDALGLEPRIRYVCTSRHAQWPRRAMRARPGAPASSA